MDFLAPQAHHNTLLSHRLKGMGHYELKPSKSVSGEIELPSFRVGYFVHFVAGQEAD